MNYIRWDMRHGAILCSICNRFQESNIRYFLLRNYHGLPEINPSKDVDIIVDPAYLMNAKKILKEEYKKHNIDFYYEARFAYLHCCHGINIESKLGIHIDIIGSYVSKGSELFTFDELYSHTEDHNNFRVLNSYFDGIMIFIYKQFNYNPKLKDEYKEIIYDAYYRYPEFKKTILILLGKPLSDKIFTTIEEKNFEAMILLSKELTTTLRRYAFLKNPIKTIKYTFLFYIEKIDRILTNYSSYAKVFAVMAPDGAGKTTFLDNLIEKLNFYFVNDPQDNRFHVYHFRPNILPNLGELGEKSGIKEQDKDFTNPHRAKPANFLSSFIRISYYWLDYIIGYSILIRKDVQYDRFSVFDRYSYDFLVDPLRSRINLPLWIRKIYVKCMHHPKVVFYLNADPKVIFERKQELTLNEIIRQNHIYNNVANSDKRFVKLDANRPSEVSVDEAVKIVLNTFCEKL